jgi:hypothetical protein
MKTSLNKKKVDSSIMPNGMKKNPKSENGIWTDRVLIFTPTTGSVRMEWVLARYGQVIPTNWSNVGVHQFLSPFVPLEYQLADAQNLMAKKVVEDDYKWIIWIEEDNVIPDNTFWKFNDYINNRTAPVVSGLYFVKSEPPEPILYRGRGTSYYRDWELGDKVWVDGVPMGCLLMDAELIKQAWKESPEYVVGGELTRRVFGAPSMMWFDEEKGGSVATGGTTDLAWCTRCMKDRLFEKAGWPEFQDKEFPFLVDTSLFVRHIDKQGRQYPLQFPEQFLPKDPAKLAKAVKILSGKY